VPFHDHVEQILNIAEPSTVLLDGNMRTMTAHHVGDG
jgi:hypothetical protein